jgi:ribosomal protein S17E
LGEIFGTNLYREHFQKNLDSNFDSNQLAVKSTITINTEVIFEDSNSYNYVGNLIKRMAEEYVKF